MRTVNCDCETSCGLDILKSIHQTSQFLTFEISIMQVLRAKVEGTLIFANVYIFFSWCSFLPEHLFKLYLQGNTYSLAHCSNFYIVPTNQFQRPKKQVFRFKTEITLFAVIDLLLVSFLISMAK